METRGRSRTAIEQPLAAVRGGLVGRRCFLETLNCHGVLLSMALESFPITARLIALNSVERSAAAGAALAEQLQDSSWQMIIVYYSAGLLLLVEFDWIVGGAALNPLALPRSGGDLGPTFPYSAEFRGQRIGALVSRNVFCPDQVKAAYPASSGTSCDSPCRDVLRACPFERAQRSA
ncbi:hypothetical protein CGC20_1705 [Leishmania donovani]|uniref:Uncharacterized protein n=1 Tax=Leishmania donovani TaxID=5661 RepID=A0A504XYY3_LEIDO|nr:hypothetical protein CGC20_1705 [Leishmania donovani]